MFHLLKINISEAEALAVYRVGDGAVHHVHLLRLHGTRSPGVPAEVVRAAVDVESIGSERGPRSRPAGLGAARGRGRTEPPAPGSLAFRAPCGPSPGSPRKPPQREPSPPPQWAPAALAGMAITDFSQQHNREGDGLAHQQCEKAGNCSTQFCLVLFLIKKLCDI